MGRQERRFKESVVLLRGALPKIGRAAAEKIAAEVQGALSLAMAEIGLTEAFREARRECGVTALTPRQTDVMVRDVKRLLVSRFGRMRTDKRGGR